MSGVRLLHGAVVAWMPDAHLLAESPWRKPERRRQRFAVTVRLRGRGRWRWWRVELAWPRRDLRLGRGVWTLEAKSWLSRSVAGNPIGLKVFIRLRVGLGGPRPDNRKEQQ